MKTKNANVDKRLKTLVDKKDGRTPGQKLDDILKVRDERFNGSHSHQVEVQLTDDGKRFMGNEFLKAKKRPCMWISHLETDVAKLAFDLHIYRGEDARKMCRKLNRLLLKKDECEGKTSTASITPLQLSILEAWGC